MADVPESPQTKSLREKAESLERLAADARAQLVAHQQAKAAANDGDGDAKMLPPIEELAVTDAADDAAAQPKESSDESSDDDLRRVAQKKTSDATTTRSRPATPVVARDAMAADWGRHLKTYQLWEKLQSQLPVDETGEILELHVQRETGLALDGWNFDNPYACYKDSKACFDANQRRVNYRAALDAADALRARCDTCLMLLDDGDDFDVGDSVKVDNEIGVVTRLPENGYWKVHFKGEDKPRSVRAGTLTSLDGGATGSCFRLGCGRERCASCQAVNPLKAPSLCQECPTGIYFPDEAQTVFPPGAPKLFEAWSLKEDFLAELQKDSPDPRAVIEFLRRDLDFLSRPTGVHLSDQLFMKALKDRLLSSHRVGRWLGDRLIGTTAWRIRDIIGAHIGVALKDELRAADDWCRDNCAKDEYPGDGNCALCADFLEACDEAAEEAKKVLEKRDRDAVERDRDAVAERTSELLPMITGAQRANAEIAAAEGDGEAPTKRGTGKLVADHVKYWPLFRMWVCQWCNSHFTWIFDTFPDARAKFKKAVKMAFISLADMNSAV